MKKSFLLLILIAISLFGEKIRDIKFDGLVHISPDIAKEIIGIRAGEEMDEVKIDESIKRLYSQNYFEDIWVDDNNGVLTYHVKEKPVISKVALEGYGSDKEEETLKELNLKKGDLYDERKLKAVKESLTKKLESQGYYDSIVEIENKKTKSGSMQTNIVVNKGEPVYIKKVNLIGAKHFSYDDIKDVVANRQREFMGWFFGRDDGKLKADQLKFDAGRIKEFYLSHGFLDAKVYPPHLKTDFSDYTAELTYQIEEGEPYRVGRVDIEVDSQVIDPQKIRESFKLKSGKTFDVNRLRKDISHIQDLLSEKGYAFARVVPDVDQDRVNHIVNITYKVQPNHKVYVNNITIAGNSRTQDSVIRRELYLTEGEEFSKTDLIDSLNALKRTGYFNDVKIIPKEAGGDKMDLLVQVNEASTGSIMGGISYGTYDGFGVNAGISDRNFMGTGIELGTTIDYSEKTLKGSINFNNPRLFDSLYSLSGNIYKKDYDYINYKEKSVGGMLSLGRRVGRNFHISLAYLYEDTELTDVNESLQDNIYYQEGRFVKSSLIPSVTYDNTDDYYLPRHGVHIGLSSEFAGLGGESKFQKTSFIAKYYHGFEDQIDYDLILRAKVRVSTINDKGYLPLNEKLYMGGYGTVRGYRYAWLSPKDEDGNLIGATKMAAATVELSIPLVKSMNLRAVAFYDRGMTGEDNFNDIKRSSYGAGLEWPRSPLGVPLSIYWASPIDDEEDDRLKKVEFNLGRKF
jgi:outer membrane protein insertion porin family